jgi:hypothetical protein
MGVGPGQRIEFSRHYMKNDGQKGQPLKGLFYPPKEGPKQKN